VKPKPLSGFVEEYARAVKKLPPDHKIRRGVLEALADLLLARRSRVVHHAKRVVKKAHRVDERGAHL